MEGHGEQKARTESKAHVFFALLWYRTAADMDLVPWELCMHAP
jgi:hypothetical protein